MAAAAAAAALQQACHRRQLARRQTLECKAPCMGFATASCRQGATVSSLPRFLVQCCMSLRSRLQHSGRMRHALGGGHLQQVPTE